MQESLRVVVKALFINLVQGFALFATVTIILFITATPITAASCEISEVSNSSSTTGLTQAKYDQLVSLLQQANLFPSTLPSTGPSTNHISGPLRFILAIMLLNPPLQVYQTFMLVLIF